MRTPSRKLGRIDSGSDTRTWAQLDNWYRNRGTSLHRQACKLLGRDPYIKAVAYAKAAILTKAECGSDRPPKGTFLGIRLGHYTAITHSSYDKLFDTKLRKLRPDWQVKV